MKNTLKIVIMTVLAFSTTVYGKLYKWVDENGKVHYSDKMPPDQIKNAHQELNEHGVVKERVDRALTPEERQAKAEELQRQKELEQQQQLEAARVERERNKLIKSYSSSEQIVRLKEERVSALKRNIEMAKENLVIQNRNLDDMLKRAADKERSGDVVSDTFLNQIETIREQIENQKIFIKEKTAEITSTQEKYDDELAKYLKYTQQDSEQQ